MTKSPPHFTTTLLQLLNKQTKHSVNSKFTLMRHQFNQLEFFISCIYIDLLEGVDYDDTAP